MSECNWPTCGCRHNLTSGPCCKATVRPSVTFTVVQPPHPLAALAMRERAADAYCKGDWDWFSDADDAIRALPTTFTDAELLAAAMQLPEVRALVDVANAMKPQLERRSYESINMYTGKTERHFGVSGETWSVFCAALAPFTKGGAP